MFPLLCSVLSTQTRLKMSQYLNKTSCCVQTSHQKVAVLLPQTHEEMSQSLHQKCQVSSLQTHKEMS